MVFGLNDRPPPDADPCPNDLDCDLVLDSIDNCIDTPNPDQRDFDGDQIGDRCDPCSIAVAPLNDDDADTVLDGTDNCPGTANLDQADADGDGVGDACDPRLGIIDARTCFFPFVDVERSKRMWGLADPWTVQSTRLIHFPATTAPFAVLAEAAGLLPTYGGYALQTATGFSSNAAEAVEIGIGIGSPSLADPGLRCLVDGAFGGQLTVTLLDPAGAVLARQDLPSLNGAVAIEMRATRSGGGTAVACIASIGSAQVMVTASGPALDAVPTPRLISTRAHTVFFALTLYRIDP